MFKPVYRVTKKLVQMVESLASMGALFHAAEVKLSVKSAAARDALARNVHSSTWIEGNLLSLANVRAISDHSRPDSNDRQTMEVTNCLKAMRYLLKYRKEKFSREDILRTHKRMTSGLLPSERCGKFRNVQNYIVNGRQQIIFTPPPPRDVAQRMDALAKWIVEADAPHAVILSAIFHHEFVAIHPFVDGNGRVARALSQWILWQGGIDPLFTLGLDEYYAKDRVRYYDLIQQTHDMDGDYQAWLEYVAEGLMQSAETARIRMKPLVLKHKGVVLTGKQEQLLQLLEDRGALGSAQICQAMNINRARVNQLISPLVKAGLVIHEGAARSTAYRLKPTT